MNPQSIELNVVIKLTLISMPWMDGVKQNYPLEVDKS